MVITHQACASTNMANTVTFTHSLFFLSPCPACLSQTDFEKDVDLACQTGELSLPPDFSFSRLSSPLSNTGLAPQRGCNMLSLLLWMLMNTRWCATSRHSCGSHWFCPISVQQAYVRMRPCLIVHDNNTPRCVQTCYTRWWLCVCVCVWACVCVCMCMFGCVANTMQSVLCFDIILTQSLSPSTRAERGHPCKFCTQLTFLTLPGPSLDFNYSYRCIRVVGGSKQAAAITAVAPHL